MRTADEERQALLLLHAGGFLHEAVEERRLQRLGHRSDMQHAKPKDDAGRGGGAPGHAALDMPAGHSARAATDTGVARGEPEELERVRTKVETWAIRFAVRNRYGTRDNGFNQGGRVCLDMDPCESQCGQSAERSHVRGIR